VVVDARVSRSKEKVVRVTLDLLAERGVAGTSVEAIAERSGVAKTTVYRHWPTKADVVLDAIATCIEPARDPDTGSLPGDLHELVGGLCEALSSTPWAAFMPSLIDAAQRDEEFARVHHRFAAAMTAPLRSALARGVERGELPKDVDQDEVVDLLSAPMFYRRLVSGGPLDRTYAERVVDRVLRAYR